ncbi:hypothetical protein CEXT_26481, partial [Caerostris extrusa]
NEEDITYPYYSTSDTFINVAYPLSIKCRLEDNGLLSEDRVASSRAFACNLLFAFRSAAASQNVAGR